MSKKLVVVESPAKAKTINQYLGSDFVVKASYGHVRDLPKSKLGIEVEHDFKPQYQAIPKAKKVIADLKAALKGAAELYLATDFDREGEAIAWHLVEALRPTQPVHRITFHEITRPAIEKAISAPRQISEPLVDAQQARRILDRLVGYKLSPFLWKKVYRGLSAGRVQSVAVRLIVEREREIKAHKVRQYWAIDAIVKAGKDQFRAYLTKPDSTVRAEFDSIGEAQRIAKKLRQATLTVESVEKTTSSLKPSPPLITSTMQQAAARYCRYSAKKTMKIAQDLYEGVEIAGKTVALITYMRTDSYQISEVARKQAGKLIAENYGARYLPSTANIFSRKVKGAQEAHEAIRPTDFHLTPESLKGKISKDHWSLYNLIYRQALASLMAPAEVETTTVLIKDTIKPRLLARGRRLVFDGQLKVLGKEEDFAELPELEQGQVLTAKSVETTEHFTEPPSRYSEASLVKELERRGIGRPSTYAPIMSTIVERGYVSKLAGRFVAEPVSEVVTDLLVENFPSIVDYDFTAEMEAKLDDIAEGHLKLVPVIKEFYEPFAKTLSEKEKTVSKKEITEESTDQKCPECGKALVIKLGRFGKFYACSGFPECKHTAPFLDDKFSKQEEKEIEVEAKEKCPKCHGELAVKQSRFGTFLGCSNYPKCKFTKSIVIHSGVKCPDCGGDLLKKKSRKGEVFWGCSNYPKCQRAYWDEPSSEKCPACSNLMLKKKDGLTCSQCGFSQATKQPTSSK